MTVIDRSQVFEESIGSFSADASELGWKPGFFPEAVKTNLGNGQPLIKINANSAGAKYEQMFGCIKVVVWND